MKAKQTHPKRGSSSNNVGGPSLDQGGPAGGAHRQADGSLNMKGFGKGNDGWGVVGKGFENSPIPSSEQ
jgi:hypothetical protein